MIIAGGLDSVPGIDILGGLMPACAPQVGIMMDNMFDEDDNKNNDDDDKSGCDDEINCYQS